MPGDSTRSSAKRIQRRAIAAAISAAMAGTGTSAVQAQQSGGGIEEVIVSARKRDENIQDIPQSVLSFSSEELTKKGITSLNDVAKFVPAMTVVGSGAGLNKIVFRGLADSIRPYLADSSAAIYLDEQPLTTGAQSPEIRPIDIDRIESLAGPQGTLYGASSQSGTVRYIVSKPDPEAFDANVGAGVHGIDDGGQGWDVDGMVNIPVIKDKLAIRLVGFAAKDAGFIDNVLGKTPYAGTKTNASQVDDDFNDANWKGGRASIKWLVNDDWAATGIFNIHQSKINGFNDYDPTKGDLNTVKFHDEGWDDDWKNFQFTLDGDLGFAQLSSSTSYFERDTAYQFDGTNGVAYYHSVLGVYGRGNCATDPGMAEYNIYDFATACSLNGSGTDIDDGDPTGYFRNDQRDERWTHETRLTGTSSRLDWTLGFFYQEADQHWVYGTHIDDYTRTESWAAYNVIYGPLEPTDVRWGSSEKNTRKDTAVFGEATVDITDQWKLLLGARWYKAEMERTYKLTYPATAPGETVDVDGDDDGLLPKIGLQYYFHDDLMVYALYSEGFRLGGVNRDRAQQRGLTSTFPLQYDSDILENWEAGLKSQWFDGHFQANITAYHQLWSDMQLELPDPQNGDLIDTDGDGSGDTRYPYQTVIANLSDAVVDGFDLDLTYVTDVGLSFGLVSTYLFQAELEDDVSVTNPNDPTDVTFEIKGGTRLPLTADLNVSAYAEYEWPLDLLGGGDAYVRLQYAYTDGSWNRLIDDDDCGPNCKDINGKPLPFDYGYLGRVRQTDYALWDVRAGFNSAEWEFSFYLDNLMDQRVISYHDTNVDLMWRRDNIVTSTPRMAGMSVRKHFK